MDHLPAELELPDFDFFAWDARGHGRSPGERGHSPSFGTSVRDVQTFVDHIGAQHGFAPSRSPSSRRASARCSRRHGCTITRRAFARLVLASPAFDVKLYVPFALPGLRLMRALRGNFFVKSYVKAKFLSRDPERIASYDTDPLIARAISVDVLLGLYEASARIVTDAAAIAVPTQLLISGADWVVRHGPQHAFFDASARRTRKSTSCPDSCTTRSAKETVRRRSLTSGAFVLELFDAGAAAARSPHGASPRVHQGRGGCAGLAVARAFGARRCIGARRGPASFQWPALGRHPARPRDRIRFRQHARLRLSERGARGHARRAARRPHLSRLHRLARHSHPQAARRGVAAAGDAPFARARRGGEYRRHRGRQRPLRLDALAQTA
jgi:hypothetical protein